MNQVLADSEHKIAITGATGFVGPYVVNALLDYGVPRSSIHLVGNATERSHSTNFHAVDIAEKADVEALISELKPSGIIHLAAVASPAIARDNPARTRAVNVDGTKNLADAVLQASPHARFVFASSSEVYGTAFNEARAPIVESVRPKPLTVYAASKADAESLLLERAKLGLNLICLRPFNHTGPEQIESYVVPAFASQIARIERNAEPGIIKVGNLDAKRDFLDVRDVARGYVEALFLKAAAVDQRVFNVSTGAPVRIRDLLDILLSYSDADIRIEIDPNRLRPSDVLVASGDPHNALDILNWEPQYSLQTTLLDSLNFWRKEVKTEAIRPGKS